MAKIWYYSQCEVWAEGEEGIFDSTPESEKKWLEEQGMRFDGSTILSVVPEDRDDAIVEVDATNSFCDWLSKANIPWEFCDPEPASFVAVVLNRRSVIPDSAHRFDTLAKAKTFVESRTSHKEARWAEHEEGKFVFGFEYADGEVEDPLAVVFGIDELNRPTE